MKKKLLSIGLITIVGGSFIVTADSGLDAESFTIESKMTANTGEVFSSSFGHKLSSRDEDPGGGIVDPVGIFEFTIDTSVSTTCTNPGIYLSGVGPETTLTHGGTGIQTPINDGGLTQLTESGTWIIQGEFDSIGQSSQNPANSSCLVSVDRWDDETGTTDLSSAFRHASNLTHVERVPNNVTIMSSMFRDATSFDQDISSWDVSSVTNMNYMFDGATSFNNGGEPFNWDYTGNVTTMGFLFNNASSFNQDISSWDVSSVTTFSSMFYGASEFNNGGVKLDWNDTGSATRMDNMFRDASEFDQDISNWDVSSVDNMNNMFYGASIFNNGGNPLNWGDKTSNVTKMGNMFREASVFDQDLSGWDVSSVNNMSQMFRVASSFNNGGEPLDWGNKTSNVTNMSAMFFSAISFDQDISNWDVSKVTSMTQMFMNATSFNQDISDWKVPLIASKPTGFDASTPVGFRNPAKQPQWGVSP